MQIWTVWQPTYTSNAFKFAHLEFLEGVAHLDPTRDPERDPARELSLDRLKPFALVISRWIFRALASWGLSGALFSNGEFGGMGERVLIDVFLEASIPLLMALLSPLIDSIVNQVVWMFQRPSTPSRIVSYRNYSIDVFIDVVVSDMWLFLKQKKQLISVRKLFWALQIILVSNTKKNGTSNNKSFIKQNYTSSNILYYEKVHLLMLFKIC